MSKKVLFATGNNSKVKRFKEKLLKYDIEIISIKDLDIKVDVEENGKDAIDNALIKARAYAKKVNIPVFAMDDSLYIENIPENKQPGLFVRRVNGKTLNDNEMIEYYTNLAKEYGTNNKLRCKWIYGIAVINNMKESIYTWSKEDFYIVDKPVEEINDGYPLNSISVNIKLNKYFTEITEKEKLEIQEDESDVVNFLVESLN